MFSPHLNAFSPSRRTTSFSVNNNNLYSLLISCYPLFSRPRKNIILRMRIRALFFRSPALFIKILLIGSSIPNFWCGDCPTSCYAPYPLLHFRPYGLRPAVFLIYPPSRANSRMTWGRPRLNLNYSLSQINLAATATSNHDWAGSPPVLILCSFLHPQLPYFLLH